MSMKMKITYLFLLILPLFAAKCGQGEVVENVDDSGKLAERYSLKKGTEIKHGKYESFYPSGKVMEESYYAEGELQGPRKVFFENGQIDYSENYDKGQFQGEYLKYNEKGQLIQQGQYIDNAMSGLWKGWYETGELKEEVEFKNNNENGPFKEFHSNGKIKTEGNYKNGDNEQGELLIYNENGKLAEKMYCEYGVCASAWKLGEGDIEIDSARIQRLAKIKIDAGLREE